MLWIYDPAEPTAQPTQSGLDGKGGGAGDVLILPPCWRIDPVPNTDSGFAEGPPLPVTIRSGSKWDFPIYSIVPPSPPTPDLLYIQVVLFDLLPTSGTLTLNLNAADAGTYNWRPSEEAIRQGLLDALATLRPTVDARHEIPVGTDILIGPYAIPGDKFAFAVYFIPPAGWVPAVGWYNKKYNPFGWLGWPALSASGDLVSRSLFWEHSFGSRLLRRTLSEDLVGLSAARDQQVEWQLSRFWWANGARAVFLDPEPGDEDGNGGLFTGARARWRLWFNTIRSGGGHFLDRWSIAYFSTIVGDWASYVQWPLVDGPDADLRDLISFAANRPALFGPKRVGYFAHVDPSDPDSQPADLDQFYSEFPDYITAIPQWP